MMTIIQTGWGSTLLMVLSLLFLSLMGVHSETVTPYLSFRGRNLSNHSYVSIIQVMWYDNVECHSKLEGCCKTEEGPRGDWFFPNGSMLKTDNYSYGTFQIHRFQKVNIRRLNWSSLSLPPEGVYHCDIAVTTDKPSVHQSLYVGLYTTGGIIIFIICRHIFGLRFLSTSAIYNCLSVIGAVMIPDGITLGVDSDLNGASPQFTLTCLSTGGPATTVTWTRDSTTVTEGNKTVLIDTTTAEYIHTLAVAGRMPGIYSCTVKNMKPSSDSRKFSVTGISKWPYP